MSHFGADSEIAQVQYIPKATGLQINSTINNNAIQMSQHLLMRKKKAFSAKWLHKFPFFESVAHFLAQTQKKRREREHGAVRHCLHTRMPNSCCHLLSYTALSNSLFVLSSFHSSLCPRIRSESNSHS